MSSFLQCFSEVINHALNTFISLLLKQDFKKGMNAYLSKHKYTNTFTEDLWEALGDASGKPVQRIMSTWTKQMGFPVLTVIITFRILLHKLFS